MASLSSPHMVLSVIIPVFNEGKHLGATLSQLKNISHTDTEILVIDGGSMDDTCAIANQAGVRVIASPVKGRAAQMNLGAREARGELLFFVHADTLVPEHYYTHISRALTSWDMGNFRYQFDSSSWWLRCNAHFTRYNWLVSQGGDKTFFISKRLFLDLGGYDENHVIMEEYDFMRRAWKAGYRLITLPENCVVSSRKYQKNSYLRIQLTNLVVYNLWRWNILKPRALLQLYRSWLK